MSSMRTHTAAALLLATLTVSGQPAVAATTADAAATVTSVWVEKEVSFPYKGLTTYYSCDGLRDKVAKILKAIGARPGFKVDVRSCVHDMATTNPLAGVEPMPSVYIRAALPQPATAELLAELAKPDAKGELVARVQGTGGPAVTEAAAQFPARWNRVRFVGTQLGPVQLGDCELLEEMRDAVFVPLGAKVVEDAMACVPKQVTPGSVRLTVEVLQPVPQP